MNLIQREVAEPQNLLWDHRASVSSATAGATVDDQGAWMANVFLDRDAHSWQECLNTIYAKCGIHTFQSHKLLHTT